MVLLQTAAQSEAVGASILGLACVGFGILLGLAATLFWIWMLVDCLTNEPSEGNDKLVWALVILLLHGLGALIYFFARRPARRDQFGR
jgi:hypothetical protein